MKDSSISLEEAKRLQALFSYHILDTPAEKDFDDIVCLASQICQTPISLISLLDQERLWAKAKIGVEASEIPREITFCTSAITQNNLFIIGNTLEDNQYCENPLVVGDPHIRFYAGMPLITPTGYKLGTLCVMDQVPRQLTSEQKFALELLSRQVVQQLELRQKNRQLANDAEMLQLQNQQLNEMHQRSEETNQLMSRFLSIISHDVRTPVNLLRGFLPLLTNDDIPAQEQKKVIDKISLMLVSTDELLSNLVHWTSRQIKGMSIHNQPINLEKLVESELFKLAIPASQKHNLLINAMPSLTAWADYDILRFILRNLLGNANKYTVSGTIEVRGWEEYDLEGKEHLVISIKDSGRGMSKEQQNKLFNWQDKNSQPGTNGERGSGVGLLLCRDFISDLQGRIWLESEPDQGTTFFFTLVKYNQDLHRKQQPDYALKALTL
ncbi:GAF domain-containing sensor histidine kinase [Cytophagaceae bacterium DM2B3-1]|uniref:histidine kinase n=1 Tax=Xanthocytophaga flava TaxID=3048013 RepID=A0ABT7CTS3_9BACT|nr:GAF domain-containing sensor histidine kinase [Xanthocytophaga flavus]MDJ1497132.1 GAF domain-containing sensor histidine kinase [Xanthocytophaga flavus]